MHSLVKRAREALLLGLQPAVNRFPLLIQLRILAAHELADRVGVAAQEAGFQAEAQSTQADERRDFFMIGAAEFGDDRAKRGVMGCAIARFAVAGGNKRIGMLFNGDD